MTRAGLLVYTHDELRLALRLPDTVVVGLVQTQITHEDRITVAIRAVDPEAGVLPEVAPGFELPIVQPETTFR